MLALFSASDTQQLAAPSSHPTPHLLGLLGYPGFLQCCILAGSSASLCHALGWSQFFMLSPHGGSFSFFLLDPVQLPFSQIPIPNPLFSHLFLSSSFSVQSAPFSTCLCVHCSRCLGQDGVCEQAGAAKSQGGTGLVVWIAAIHGFAYLEILLRLECILKQEKFQGI